jgi:hypothetical protein
MEENGVIMQVQISWAVIADPLAQVKVFRRLLHLPAAIGIQSKGSDPALVPAFWFDHAEVVFSIDLVEVVALADDRFEAKLCLVDQLVPIEGINDLQVALPQFDEFLLEFTLHLGDASRFK